jgi:hypothetical protein
MLAEEGAGQLAHLTVVRVVLAVAGLAQQVLLLQEHQDHPILAAVVVAAEQPPKFQAQAAPVLSSSLIQTFTLHQQLRQDRQQ